MKIAILGSGFSALFADLACHHLGFDDVTVYSLTKSPPKVRGFQYLHEPCGLRLNYYSMTELVESPFPVEISSVMYSLKVYQKTDVKNSVHHFSTNEFGFQAYQHHIYNLDEALALLWPKFEGKIHYESITPEILKDLTSRFDYVFSSIEPFTEYKQYVTSYVADFPVKIPYNAVYYIVDLSNPIYRCGSIFGRFFVESTTKMYSNSMPVIKVISPPDVQSLAPNLIPIGRYGEWNKEVLISDVYHKVKKVLNANTL